ncbi:MAG TPA: hypothetical protein VE075_01210 [Thermoanaerobaculia bacterium]|nr:hypothetical protein [Thermoanaerobaculia bacterium]
MPLSLVRNLTVGAVAIAGALSWLSTGAGAQAVTFFDGDFPDSSWKDTAVVNTLGLDLWSTATVAAGGNPGAFRETKHTIAGSTTLRVAHVNLAALYSPAAQGQIASVSFTFSAEIIAAPLKVAYSLLILQNNTYYSSSPLLVVATTAWSSFATGPLAASQFTRISDNGPASPDFSCGAAPILFGFWTANSAGAPYSTDSGIDNWKVDVTPGPACGQSACACDLDFKPAATLLLPYFEVDLAPAGDSTLLVVNNALPTAILANVVIWSDLAVPVASFNVYFTGNDQQAFDLRTILVDGVVPQTGPGISPGGTGSAGGSFPNCGSAVPAALNAAQVQRDLTGAFFFKRGVRFGSCVGRYFGDGKARGYVTIDTISRCTTSFPGDPGYFLAGGTGVATDVNALYGHYTYVDRERNAAEGFSLVSIKANPTDPATSTPGRYTFYGRLVGWTASDNREPLATTFGADYLSRVFFANNSVTPVVVPFTDIIVWRDPKVVQGDFPCSSAPAWYPLGEEAVFELDNQENVLLTDAAPTSPALPKDHPLFPAAAQRIRGFPTLANAGWLYLDLNTFVVPAGPNPPFDPAAAQAWVTYVSPAYGLSTGYEAVRFDSGCSPVHIGVP